MKKIRKELLKILRIEFPLEYKELDSAINNEFSLIKKDIVFAKDSKNPMDKRMPVSAYLLAVIKTLNNKEVEYENIRKLILEIANELTKSKNTIHGIFKSLIPLFLTTFVARILLIKINKKSKQHHQKDGFLINVLTSKEETLGFGYGVDILECGICKLFSKHKYERFVPILCEVDYLTSSLSGLQLLRKGTIANGSKICDFRYKKL